MILERLLEPKATHAPWDDFWYQLYPGYDTQAGVTVSVDRIEQIAAVHCARAILSETLAHVPLKTQRRIDRGKEVALDHPLYRVLHDSPNNIQTSLEWREQMMGDLVFRGNCYSEIWPPRGTVKELRPLHPDRMTPVLLPNFRIGYSYRDENNEVRSYLQQEILHVRGYSKNVIQGMSPIGAMRESMGLTMALEQFGASLFKNGALHRMIFKHPGKLSDGAFKRLKEDLRAESGMSTANTTRILEEGMSTEKISMTSDDAQFLLSRKFQISEIARWFHIPPHLIGDLEKATFSNIEEQELEFVIFTMVPWFVRWEQALDKALFGTPEIFAEFVVDGLLRGDIQKRYTAYREGVTNGWLTRNEVRQKENLNSAPGLDDFLVPLNMATIDQQGRVVPLEPPTAPEPAPAPEPDDEQQQALARLGRIQMAVAQRAIRKEGQALLTALKRHGDDPVKMQSWAEKFYKDHADYIAEGLAVDRSRAETFAAQHKARVLCSIKDNCVAGVLKELDSADPQAMVKFLQNGHA